MITVGNVLETKGSVVWQIGPHETAYDALELMAEKDIGALLVVDGNAIVGIFSERDYARKVILKGRSSKVTSVGELMSTPVFFTEPGKTIEECMALMTTRRLRHLPVLDNGHILGMISIGDVVNALIKEQKITISDLESYITGGYVHESA